MVRACANHPGERVAQRVVVFVREASARFAMDSSRLNDSIPKN